MRQHGQVGSAQASGLVVVIVSAVVGLLLLPSQSSADRLLLRNGNAITGTIEAESPERVTVRTPGGLVTFRADAIASVERQSSEEAYVAAVRNAAARGDLTTVGNLLGRPITSPALRQQIDSVLEFHAASLAASTRASLAEAVRLSRYVDDRQTSAAPSLHLLLARIFATAGDSRGAVQRLKQLDVTWLRRAEIRREIVPFLQEQIEASLVGEDTNQGLDCLELLAQVAPERMTTTTAVLFHLNRARELTESGRYLDAVNHASAHVLPTAPALAWNEAAEAVAAAEQRTSHTVRAEVYAAVEAAFTRIVPDADIIPIYERHVLTLISLERFDKAREIAAELSHIDADIGAPMEHRVDLARRRRGIAADDLVGHYRLGVWAREMGLVNEARALLKDVEHDPSLRENAALQLEVLETDEQRARFEEGCRLVERGAYEEGRRALEEFRTAYPQGPFAQKAAELAEIARYRKWLEDQRRPAEAEILRQNAERLALQQRHNEALELLDRLEVEYGKTEAARRAAPLRTHVERQTGRTGRNGGGEPQQKADLRARRMAEIQAMARELARRP